MRIERVTLTNFRCFGPDPVEIDLSPDITALHRSERQRKDRCSAGIIATIRRD